MSSRVPLFFLTLAALSTATVIVTLWAKGYTLNKKEVKLEKTGMILAKSSPDGAKIFVDGKLTSATNATLSGLKGGRHQIRIEKEGFISWKKEVEVKEELVLEINAVLIPLTPELKPLTTTGAKSPLLSSDRTRIFYLTAKATPPGVWSLPLTQTAPWLNIFRPTPRLAAADRREEKIAFSAGTDLAIAPDDSQLLIEMNPQGFYLLLLGQVNLENTVATSSAQPTFSRWDKIEKEIRTNLLEKTKKGKEFKEIAFELTTLPSPNGKRFLYEVERGDKIEYHVRDLSEPLGVGDKEDYLTFVADKEQLPKVSWYSDSRHLILVEGSAISLVEIDGDNKTKVYSGKLLSDNVFPTPDGSKLIALTSFNPEAQGDLYAISLR